VLVVKGLVDFHVSLAQLLGHRILHAEVGFDTLVNLKVEFQIGVS
jgi:hypothetical protein